MHAGVTADAANGIFEALGGVLIWMSVRRIARDKQTRGVFWPATMFFTAWGFWNLYYYPSLHQWLSFVGGLNIVVANCFWLWLAIRYRRN